MFNMGLMIKFCKYFNNQYNISCVVKMNPINPRMSLRYSFVSFPNKNSGEFMEEEGPESQILARYYDQSYLSTTDFSKKKDFLQSFTDKLIVLIDKMPIIAPESTLLLLWNLLVVLAILYNLCQIPISIFLTERVYQSQFESSVGIAINVIFILVLLVDIFFVRPNIGIYVMGKMVTSHKEILKKYLYFEFQFDCIAWLVLLAYAISNNYQFIYAKILFYLYFITLYRVDTQISVKLELLRLRYAFYKLMRVIFIMLFIVLWLSCIYFAIDYAYYIAQNQYYPQNLWLTNSVCSQYQGGQKFINLVQMYDWYVWLIYAYYWTLQSISMVGYGDMTPRNPPQVAYCDLVILLMTLMYAFFINTVWQIIAQASQLQNLEETNRKHLMKYRKTYEIEGSMLNKLGSYMYEMWKYGQNQQIEEQINNSLTQDLRNQLLLAKQRKFFIGIGLFDRLWLVSQENTELFREWSYLIKQKNFGEEEYLFKSDSTPEYIYSIMIGQMMLEYPNSNVFCKIFENTTFGLQKFFVQQRYGFDCKTLTYNKVGCLSREDFMSALRSYPNFYEKYIELVEQIKIYKMYDRTGERCWVCSSNQHLTNRCPELFDFENQIREQFIISYRKKTGLYDHKKIKEQRWLKNIRRSIPRKSLRIGRTISKTAYFPRIQLDEVKYFKMYRNSENI